MILGYASGIGLTTPDAVAATTTKPPVASPAAPVTTPPPATSIAQPAVPGTIPLLPNHSAHTSTPEPEPTTTTEPEPTEPTETCAPSLLEGLPAVGELSSTLVSSVLTLPVVGDLVGTPTEGKAAGPLTCLIGSVVGPNCCTTSAAASKDTK